MQFRLDTTPKPEIFFLRTFIGHFISCTFGIKQHIISIKIKITNLKYGSYQRTHNKIVKVNVFNKIIFKKLMVCSSGCSKNVQITGCKYVHTLSMARDRLSKIICRDKRVFEMSPENIFVLIFLRDSHWQLFITFINSYISRRPSIQDKN